jgi:hypothetical protein
MLVSLLLPLQQRFIAIRLNRFSTTSYPTKEEGINIGSSRDEEGSLLGIKTMSLLSTAGGLQKGRERRDYSESEGEAYFQR